MLDTLLTQVTTRLRVDTNRIYVTGLSMGGSATWALAIEYPNRFAAIAPICGRGNTRLAEKIKHIPVWAFHGEQDDVIPVEQSIQMIKALTKVGGNPKLTLYPDTGHNSWTETYNNPELYEWLLSQQLATCNS